MTQSSGNDSKFRPEIQGLRATAAILVAIYHIWIGRVSGGVDVFFVVSGFLITGSLLRQAENKGRIEFLRFWAGLIKRLLPAALLVITTTIIASFLLLPQTLWISTIKQASAAIFYVENWHLAFTAVDYLANQDAQKPFQHYWALSVQGQFYVIWPVLIALTLVAARFARSDFWRLFFIVLVSVFGLSLAYSIKSTAANQPFAYFDTFARMWEFSVGGLLVYAIGALRIGSAARIIMGWIALGAVVSCGVLLQVSTVFPGYAALWPTMAASLIILCGSNDQYGAGRLLSSRPLNWFGDISYSFYLWHWPILSFYKAFPGTSEPNIPVGLVIIAASIVLAWGTTRFIEEPVRFSKIGKHKPVRAFILGASLAVPAVVMLGAWSGYTINEREDDRTLNAIPGKGDHPGAIGVFREGWSSSGVLDAPVYPGAFSIHRSIPISYDDGCHHGITGTSTDHCIYGNADGEVSIAAVGGSHSAQWLPALRELAESYNWKIYNLTKSACWFSTELKGGDNEDCLRWNQKVIPALEQISPDFVFTTATRTDTDQEHLPQGYREQWLNLDDLGIRVLAIRDNPRWEEMSPPECVDVFGPTSEQCRASRSSMLSTVSPLVNASDVPDNVRFLDLSDYLCHNSECLPVAGNVQIYRDRHHLSSAYVRSLAPLLGTHMIRIAPELNTYIDKVSNDS